MSTTDQRYRNAQQLVQLQQPLDLVVDAIRRIPREHLAPARTAAIEVVAAIGRTVRSTSDQVIAAFARHEDTATFLRMIGQDFPITGNWLVGVSPAETWRNIGDELTRLGKYYSALACDGEKIRAALLAAGRLAYTMRTARERDIPALVAAFHGIKQGVAA